ncbi:hypothetical protein V8E36_005674 [Tilletia maclaganii]
MPALRTGAASSSSKVEYVTMSQGTREFIMICDSSDEDSNEKIKIPSRNARAQSAASSVESNSTMGSPSSDGRRRSARQASRELAKASKRTDKGPALAPLSRRVENIASAASSSKRKASKGAGQPGAKGNRKNQHLGKGKEQHRSSSPLRRISRSLTPSRSSSLEPAPAVLLPSASVADQVTKSAANEQEVQNLKIEAATLRDRIAALEAEKVALSIEKDAATTTVSKMEDYLTCGVCMDVQLRPFTLQPCGHNCCLRCLHPWLGEHDTCPLCAVTVHRAFPNSDLNALAQLYLDAHPEKRHAQDECEEAETLLMLTRENSTHQPFAQLLPKHTPRQPPQNAGAGLEYEYRFQQAEARQDGPAHALAAAAPAHQPVGNAADGVQAAAQNQIAQDEVIARYGHGALFQLGMLFGR